MKTKTDYERMTAMELRSECKNNIAGYGSMTKGQMIEKLSALSESILGETPEAVEVPQTPTVEEMGIVDVVIEPEVKTGERVFTDRHLSPLEKGQRVNARIGGTRWFQGTVVKFKEIDGEEYISVLLDGRTLSKLFHTVDVEILLGSQKGVVKNLPESISEETKSSTENSVGKPVAEKTATVTTSKRRKVEPFTPEQKSRIDADITLFRDKKISKKDLVIGWMEFGITKQQIDKLVDSSVVGWAYAYDIYRQYGK